MEARCGTFDIFFAEFIVILAFLRLNQEEAKYFDILIINFDSINDMSAAKLNK